MSGLANAARRVTDLVRSRAGRVVALAAVPALALGFSGSPLVALSVLAGYAAAAVLAGLLVSRLGSRHKARRHNGRLHNGRRHEDRHHRDRNRDRRTDYLVPLELPPAPYMVGRAKEQEDLRSLLTSGAGQRVVGIVGPPGIGKTVLAIRVAHSVAGAYTGGQLFARFWAQRRDQAALVVAALREFVRSLQGPWDEEVDDEVGEAPLRERYEELTRGARVLVVLDDVGSADIAELLRPEGRDCALLLTSRERFDLPGCEWYELGPLPDSDGLHLFSEVVGEDVSDNEVAGRVAARVVEASRQVPLALRLAASLVTTWPWWTTVSAMRLLDQSVLGGDVAAEPLNLSYKLLTADEQAALRMLGLLQEGEALAPWMVEAVMRVDTPTARVVIERLVQAGFVERVDREVPGSVEYRVLDRVHDYALRRLQALQADRAAEVDAMVAALGAARRARANDTDLRALQRRVLELQDEGRPGEALAYAGEAVAWSLEQSNPSVLAIAHATLAELQIELGNLESAEDFAAAAESALGQTDDPIVHAQALRGQGRLLRRQGQPGAALEKLTAALGFLDDAERSLDAVRSLDHAGTAARREAQRVRLFAERVRLLRHRASAYADHDDLDAGLADLAAAEALKGTLPADESGPLEAGLIWARGMIVHRRDFERGIALMEEAAETAGDKQRLWRAWIRLDLARLHSRRDAGEALRYAREALDAFGDMGHRYGKAKCRLVLARVRVDEGKLDEAAAQLENALETFRNCGDRWVEAAAARDLAEIRTKQRQLAAAASLLRTSERQFSAVGDLANAQRVRRRRRLGSLRHLTAWPAILIDVLPGREAAGR